MSDFAANAKGSDPCFRVRISGEFHPFAQKKMDQTPDSMTFNLTIKLPKVYPTLTKTAIRGNLNNTTDVHERTAAGVPELKKDY